MPTSEELLDLAERCADKLDLDGKVRHIPSFSDAEDQCEDEYEELLQAIHDDELFAQAQAGATRAWDNWPARDWNGRSVEQIIPPAFPTRKN